MKRKLKHLKLILKSMILVYLIIMVKPRNIISLIFIFDIDYFRILSEIYTTKKEKEEGQKEKEEKINIDIKNFL